MGYARPSLEPREKKTYEYVNEYVTCQAPYRARIMHNPYIIYIA